MLLQTLARTFLPSVSLLTSGLFSVSALTRNGLRGTHSTQSSYSFNNMKIRILPALSDNYMYLIIDEHTNEAAIVDPVAPDTVLQAVNEEGANLTKILTTHHHWDHAGGNEELVKKLNNKNLQVFGGDKRIGGLTNKVNQGDKLKIGDINVECLFTPCHTTGHICYYLTTDNDDPAVFTGDTLFIAGCGRFFEGTPEQMCSALIDKLGNLPPQTKVFCGHEYTVQNLKFAQHVEEDNTYIQDKLKWAVDQRQRGLPTVPSTIGEEKLINPFMRVDAADVQKHASSDERIKTMASIRKEKDSFRA